MGAVKIFGCESCESKGKGIFCDLEKAALKDVGRNKIMIRYKKGQTIFTEGSAPEGIYCINSGKIKLSKISGEGKESILRLVGAGDVLGHRSLFSQENFGATATVLEDSTICFLKKDYFHKMLLTEPSVSLHLLHKLSEAMGAAETRYADLSQKTVKERLAQLLLKLKDQYGCEDKGRWRLDVKLTREEMASMIGTAPETIIRFISEFKDLGLVTQEGKTILLQKLDELKAIANASK